MKFKAISFAEMKIFPVLPEFQFLYHLFQMFWLWDHYKSEEKIYGGGWGGGGVSNIIYQIKELEMSWTTVYCTVYYHICNSMTDWVINNLRKKITSWILKIVGWETSPQTPNEGPRRSGLHSRMVQGQNSTPNIVSPYLDWSPNLQFLNKWSKDLNSGKIFISAWYRFLLYFQFARSQGLQKP